MAVNNILSNLQSRDAQQAQAIFAAVTGGAPGQAPQGEAGAATPPANPAEALQQQIAAMQMQQMMFQVSYQSMGAQMFSLSNTLLAMDSMNQGWARMNGL